MRIKKIYGLLIAILCSVFSVHAAGDGIIKTEYLDPCAGDTITINLISGPQKVYNNTTLRDTIHGLEPDNDSITVYVVTFHPSYETREERQLLSGTTFDWHGQTIDKAGVYRDSKQTIYGCDSIFILNVTAISSVIETLDTTVTICQGTSYTWHGITAESTGDFSRTVTTPYNTQMTYTLHLIVKKVDVTKISESICYGSSYSFGGKTLTEPNLYRDTLLAVDGCDSIVELTLNVLYPDTTVVYLEADENDAAVWNGVTYKGLGEHVIRTQSQGGCYSITRLILLEHRIEHVDTTATICQGDYIDWKGIVAYTEGDYKRTVVENGTTLVYGLHLHVKETPVTKLSKQICEGDQEYWHGKLITESDIYRDTLQAVGACDSIVEWTINVVKPDLVIVTHELEDGETYRWNGKEYKVAGVYTYQTKNHFGCDSITRLVLTSHSVDRITKYDTICSGDSVKWNGIVGRATHIYSRIDTLPSGHVIIYTLNLTVKQPVHILKSLSICTGDAEFFNGKYYDTPGTYYDSISCDTIYKVVVTRLPSYESITKAVFDGVTPYIWHYANKTATVTTEGVRDENVRNTETGCTDHYHLELHKQVAATPRTIHFCEPITFKGKVYKSTTTVYDTVYMPNYVDSIIAYRLVKGEPFHSVESITISEGESLYWHGQLVSNENTYYDFNQSIAGCDSTYELHVTLLSVEQPRPIFTDVVQICSGETYTWPRDGKEYSRTDIYKYVVPAVLPDTMDTTYMLNLTVHPAYDTMYVHLYSCGGDKITYEGTDYTADATVITNYPSQFGCDSVTKAFLHFNTSSYQTYTWELADNDTSRVWHGQKVNHAGTYYYEEKLPGGCYRREELKVFMYPTFLQVHDTTICQNEAPYIWPYAAPAEWYNQPFSCTPGETLHKEWRGVTVHGVDSIYRLNLTVYPSYTKRERITICEGEKVDVNGKTYINLIPNKIYRDTVILRTINNCDSIIYYEISQYPTKHITETKILHTGDTIFWLGDTITAAGSYSHLEQQVVSGCDSINELIVIAETENTATICALDTPYIWQGHNYYTSGNWVDTVRNADGSIAQFRTLHLTVIHPVDTTVELRGCLPEGVTFHGKTYLQSERNVLDTLNCDTLYHLNIKIDPRISVSYFDTICETELPYIIGRQRPDTIWKEGTFTHKDKTACGCDSIMTVHLSIIPDFNNNDSVFICDCNISEQHPFVLGNLTHPKFADKEGGKYANAWQGKWEGIKYTHDTIVWNCSHTNYFHVIVRPQAQKDSTYYLCELDTLHFGYFANGQRQLITKEGVYYDTIKAVSGWTDPMAHGGYHYSDTLQCDSIIKLTVYMRPAYRDTIKKHIPHGDSILWGGTYKYYSGYYSDSITLMPDMNTAQEYCKAIHTLHLFVDDTYHLRDTIDVCDVRNKTITHKWNDGHIQRFNTELLEGSYHYYDSLKTKIHHFDSIYDLFVNFHITPITYLDSSICYGESIQFGLSASHQVRMLNKTGVYYDTLKAINGCDSIIRLTLNVYPTFSKDYRADIADLDTPYIWEHKKNGVLVAKDSLYASGTYSYRWESVFGCDSVDHLTLQIHNTYNYHDTITICQSELPYTWRDSLGRIRQENIETAGTYQKFLQTKDGYDSIYNLTLYVNPIYSRSIFMETCAGDSIQFNHKQYTKPGIYTDTLPTVDGCDSVITIHYQWKDVYYKRLTAQTDDKTPYLWLQGDGTTRTLTKSGVYFDSLQTKLAGCDSIIELTLTVYPTYRFEENQTICESETPYLWRGKQFWTSGIYMDSLQTKAHYDSIYVLKLNVRDTTYTNLHYSICRGESFDYNGKTYTHGGVWTDTLSSSNGCDSIIVLRIRELPDYFFSDTAAVANRKPYPWRGKIYTHTGIYRDTLVASTGCDSIYQLVLTIYDKEQFRDTTIMVCENNLPVQWRTRWLSQSATFYDTITTGDVDTIWQVNFQVIPMQYQTIEQTLCQGDSYSFNGKTFKRDTLLREIVYAGYGCGTEYTLYLHFRQPRYVDLEAKTSSDKPYRWNVEDTTYVFGFSGNYEHIVRTKDNLCDSIIYKLHLTVGSVYLFKDSMALCQSSLPYLWHNQLIYEVGTYYDSLQTVMGYDSVYSLKVLKILPSYYEEQTINLCEGASAFYYRGKAYNQKGIFYDTIPSINGCDSIFKITVRIMPTYEIYDTVHISDRQTFNFHGRELSVQGPYVYYGKTQAGCDSIEHLQLYVHPSYLFVEENELCNKDTLLWHGRVLYEGGVYYDSLLSTQGYDSVYKLTLTVHPTYYKEESIEICPNTSTWLHEMNISAPGVYYDTLYSVHGCDSIFKITVNLRRSFRQEYTVEICQGEEYEFFGVRYSRSGTYKYEIGCDSIITMHLVVRPRDITEKRVVISEEDLPYRYNGTEYTRTDIYVDTFRNVYGCDSIFKLNLIVTDHVSEWNQIPLCPGGEIRIDGQIITEAGQYTFLKRSKVSGLLDSLYRVEVFDAPDYESKWDTLVVCQGDTVYFAGKQLNRAGAYTENLKTINGCDSILHLFLVINPTYEFTTNATITDYQTYSWRGSEYRKEDKYYQSYPTIKDCDSTFILDLKVIPTQRYMDSTAICINSSMTWRGRELSEPGIYNDTVCNLASFTSIIYTLKLTVVTPTIITDAAIMDVEADAESFTINFNYSGLRPERYSIAFDELAHQQGFTDIVDEPFGSQVSAIVPIPHKDKVIYKDHTLYVRPNYYTMRLALDNGVCGISRSDSLTLLIRYPKWILEQNWDNVVVPLRKEYNGGYDFGNYEWYINNVLYENNGSPYLYTSTLKRGDNVVLYATRVGESYAIPTGALTITTPAPAVFDNPVLVYPTSTSKNKPRVTLKATSDGSYKVYNATGQLYATGTFTTGEQNVDVPATSGCCLIQATTVDGEITTTKIIVY